MLTKMNIVAAIILSFILGGLFGWNICTFEYVNTATFTFSQGQQTLKGDIASDNFLAHTEEFLMPCIMFGHR